MARTLLSTILAVWLLIGAGPASASAREGVNPLEARRAVWPQWRLPAPLPRPGRSDLEYPPWFAGDWWVTSREEGAPAAEALHWRVRFRPGRDGAVVGDRAANARAVGKALLGDDLQEVRDDPENPNRQLARLRGDRLLETTVVGRRTARDPEDGTVFLADELVLQVLHAPGDPRVSRIETLSRYVAHTEDLPPWIEAEQWQARYPSPAQGLAAQASGTGHWRLRLDPLPPESDPAS
jgi:hypothetical protein